MVKEPKVTTVIFIETYHTPFVLKHCIAAGLDYYSLLLGHQCSLLPHCSCQCFKTNDPTVVATVWNSKADKMTKLKYIVKYVVNAWATFKAWSNLSQMHEQPSRYGQNLV